MANIFLALFVFMAIQTPSQNGESSIDELKKSIMEAMEKSDTAHAIAIAEAGVETQIRIHGVNHLDVSRATLYLGGLYTENRRFVEDEGGSQAWTVDC